MELTTRSGRRAGCSRRGQPCQGVRDMWQREQETGDECHPCITRFLNAVSYCSSHSVNTISLTVQLQPVKMAKPLIHRKNHVHEN